MKKFLIPLIILIIGFAASYSLTSILPHKITTDATPNPSISTTQTPSPTAKPTFTPKPISKIIPTPFSYPNLDQDQLFAGINEKRYENGVPKLKWDLNACALVDRVVDFYVANGRFPYVPEVQSMLNDIGVFYHPQLGMGDKFTTVDQAVNYFATNPDTKSYLTGGQYTYGCIKSKKGSAALVVYF